MPHHHHPKPPGYPPGALNANWFSLFNAFSFQITLGSPMILYAKSLDASATVLGILAALTPLLTIAQIPAARMLQRVGYRRMVLAGWSTRTVFIFLLAAIPLAGFLAPATKIALLLFCLFVFNLLRGLSSGAWLPWITDLIPEAVRGRFLSRDQVFLHVGSLASIFGSALLLERESAPWRFALIFLLSAIGATISLLFLRRIPDIAQGEVLIKSNTRVPWREIVTYPPFFKLVGFNVLFCLAMGSLGVFNIAFMKSRLGFGENVVLFLSTTYFAGALLVLPFFGMVVDHTGSRPVLRLTGMLWLVHVLMWGLLAAGLLPPDRWVVGLVIFTAGFCGAGFNIANSRLLMATMPPMGRSHFFAFFSVITSLALAVSPLIWGIVLDALGNLEAAWGPVQINRFTVFYAALTLLLAVDCLLITGLTEKQPQHTVPIRDLVMGTAIGRILRLWVK